MKLKRPKRPAKPEPMSSPEVLASDVRRLILMVRETVVRGVNTAPVLVHRKIGQRILTAILGEKRSGYGQGIVATLSRELGWSHFVELLPLRKPLRRDSYARMCRVERRSVRLAQSRLSRPKTGKTP